MSRATAHRRPDVLPPEPAGDHDFSIPDESAKLSGLHDVGALTDEEFAAGKRKLLE